MLPRMLLCALFLFGCDCDEDGDGLVDSGMAPVDSAVVDMGPFLAPDTGPSMEGCENITALVRDFDVSHVDFEPDEGGLTLGLVEPTLDDEFKPVYAHGATSMGAIGNEDSFRQWYRTEAGINEEFEIELTLVPTGGGRFVYDNNFFFPVDGRGFGNSGEDDEGMQRNFHFTTEVHTAFIYEGGEVFTFRGDDDLWLFIDGQLVIDLGGPHVALEETVDIDTLGLTPGERYRLDLFHAERHTSASNFRLETSIECFVDVLI